MPLDHVTLRVEVTRHEQGEGYAELSREDMQELGINPDDYDNANDIDWYRYIDAQDWVEDFDCYDSDSSVEVDSWETRPASEPPKPLSLTVGRLVRDSDGDVFEVAEVSRDRMLLVWPDGEPVDCYDDGWAAWDDNGEGFERWFRSGDRVFMPDGTKAKVRFVGDDEVELVNGVTYTTETTRTWLWAEEVETVVEVGVA